MHADRGWDEFMPWTATAARQREAALAAARRAAVLPAYAQAWRERGIDPSALRAENWHALPLISKETLIEAARREPPFGGRLGVGAEELAHVFVSPGPLYMPFTAEDLDAVAGSFAKAFVACGLGRGDVVDQTTMYNWVIAATCMDRALGLAGCCVVPGGIGQSERHLEVIRALGVNAILAFPTFLEHLIAESGGDLPLRKAVVMGELSHPEVKQSFRIEHGLEAREFYGAADVGAIAWECAACNGMHLRDDLLVEFLQPGADAPANPSPGSPAELVVTDFHRRAMPIIRLRTGDLVDEVMTDPCECGRSSPRIARIVGRASEITKVKGMFVVPRQVQDVFRMRGVNRRFRLLVDRPEGGRDALTLELQGPTPGGLDQLKADVESALRMRIDIAVVETLPEGPLLVDRRLQRA